MKATLGGRTLAESDDVVDCDGYPYFPRAAVRVSFWEDVEIS